MKSCIKAQEKQLNRVSRLGAGEGSLQYVVQVGIYHITESSYTITPHVQVGAG